MDDLGPLVGGHRVSGRHIGPGKIAVQSDLGRAGVVQHNLALGLLIAPGEDAAIGLFRPKPSLRGVWRSAARVAVRGVPAEDPLTLSEAAGGSDDPNNGSGPPIL